jgi:hypothetical protein
MSIPDRDTQLRKARYAAHMAFDPLWKHKVPRDPARSSAYAWLARSLALKGNECHIGKFDFDLCRRTIELCLARNTELTKASEGIGSGLKVEGDLLPFQSTATDPQKGLNG